MPNRDQVRLLTKDVDAWNKWRKANPSIEIDLEDADLEESNLDNANLKRANLRRANLEATTLTRVNLVSADLSSADISESDLRWANLRNADLERAKLFGANLYRANLRNACLSEASLLFANLESADIRGADLTAASLVSTNLEGANISECSIYGISAWDINLKNTIQENLIIPLPEGMKITLANLEVAQFIYLLIDNQKLKNVIDTITSKTVLILGRFTDERKKVLNAIREELSYQNYIPIVFDFDKPASRDLTETITLLARMARFVIADLTDPKSIPQELTSIISELPSVPIQPIILSSQQEYSMYEHWKRYPWVLEIHKYKTVDDLLSKLTKKIIMPSEKMIEEMKKGSK